MDVKEEEILGNSVGQHWYYRSKANVLIRLLKDYQISSILDVGAGSGYFSRELLRYTDAKEALCIDIGYKTEYEETVAQKSMRFRRSCDAVGCDLVLMMDVLEHVDDDRDLLQSYAKRVPEGAHFVITVPAFSFLWSNHDIFLDHKRRYTLNAIENAVKDVGLTVLSGSYYFAFVFPLAASLRLSDNLFRSRNACPRSQLKSHSRLTNRILYGLCFAETPLIRLNRFCGLTVFCIAKKP